MGTLKTTVFARNRNKVNTYIGGVSSFINTPAALASVLGIVEGRISLFSIYGDNIECSISGTYSLTGFNASANSNNLNVTYYRDPFGLVNDFIGFAFYQSGIMEVFTPKATSISNPAFDMNYAYAGNRIEFLYIPLVTSLGSSALNNNVFRSAFLQDCTMYVHSSLATNNAGSPDGDIAYAITRGATIRYVTNFDAPSKPIFTIGTINNKSIQLLFTPPSSTNAIDYYEVYSNGIYKGKIKNSGKYIKYLLPSTTYSFQIIAVDIFYNKSEISDAVSATTNTTNSIYNNLIEGYKLNNSDSYTGFTPLTIGGAVTYDTGVDGNCVVFTKVAGSLIKSKYNSQFSFTDGVNDKPFSVKFNINPTSLAGRGVIVGKIVTGATDLKNEWIVFLLSGKIALYLRDKADTSKQLYVYQTTPLVSGAWKTVVITYDGSKLASGIKINIDDSFVATTDASALPYTGMRPSRRLLVVGNNEAEFGTADRLAAKVDEVYIFENVITSDEITYLQTNYI